MPIDPKTIKDIEERDPGGSKPSYLGGMAVDKLYFQPSSATIELVITPKGMSMLPTSHNSTEGEPMITALDAFGHARLKVGEHEVQPFVCLGTDKEDPTKRLRLATRSIIVTKKISEQGTANLTWEWADGQQKTVHETAYPQYIDLRFQHTKTSFFFKGEPLANMPVDCKLTLKGTPPTLAYMSKLDDSGKLEAVLAPSFVIKLEVSGVNIKHETPVVEPPPVDPKRPPPPTIFKKDPQPKTALANVDLLSNTIFLCDTSGSMDDQMHKLKQGLHNAIDDYVAKGDGRPFAIANWNNSTTWANGRKMWLRSTNPDVIATM